MGMRRISGQATGILQGSQMLFSDYADDGPMWRGAGPREVRRAVVFSEPFLEPPAVIVGISLWDLDRQTNARADIAAERVTAEGFDLVFRTWSDTRVARIRADWTAIGPVADDEMWEIR